MDAIDRLSIKLGGLPPQFLQHQKASPPAGMNSPPGIPKKPDPAKPHTFAPSKTDPLKCDVCGKAEADPLHAVAKKPAFGGKPAGPPAAGGGGKPPWLK